MAAMNDYLRVKVQDYIFRSQSFTQPTTLYVALCTTTPIHSDTGTQIYTGSGGTGVEVTGGNYARQSVACGTGSWGDSTGVITNTNAITWSSVTWTATVTGLAIVDASTNGNILFQGALTSSKSVTSGDTFTINASALSITIDS